MNTSVVTALAALAGAANRRRHDSLRVLAVATRTSTHAVDCHNLILRQELYKEFIEQSSKLYIHALQNSNADVVALMGLYAQLNRMRVMSSAAVVDSANRMLKKIVDTYLEPNKTFPELRQMSDTGLIDPLRDFSEACREEFRLRNSPFDR